MTKALTKEELAARLDGCEYEDEGLKEIFAAAIPSL
jgi:hypothetical protein